MRLPKRTLHDGVALEYDSLIPATGSQAPHFGHDGRKQWVLGLKSIEKATTIRHKIHTMKHVILLR
jgi:NADH dehydrogenase FAD-containing subunit